MSSSKTARPHAGTRRDLWKSTKARIAPYFSHSKGDVVCADALDVLRGLREESVDLLFLDPPFNLGKQYKERKRREGVSRRAPVSRRADRLDEHVYVRQLEQVLLRSCDLLKPGGALYLYHLPRFALRFGGLLSQHLVFRHWIAISMKNGFVRRADSLYPAHYALLYFTKGTPQGFQRPKVMPARCRSCKSFVKDYGGYKRFVVNGINLSDVWDDVSPVRHHANKSRAANELPRVIPARVVEMSGLRDGLFVDPFAGTGAAIQAAVAGGMRFLACDKERHACSVVRSRLKGLEDQE